MKIFGGGLRVLEGCLKGYCWSISPCGLCLKGYLLAAQKVVPWVNAEEGFFWRDHLVVGWIWPFFS